MHLNSKVATKTKKNRANFAPKAIASGKDDPLIFVYFGTQPSKEEANSVIDHRSMLARHFGNLLSRLVILLRLCYSLNYTHTIYISIYTFCRYIVYPLGWPQSLGSDLGSVLEWSEGTLYCCKLAS